MVFFLRMWFLLLQLALAPVASAVLHGLLFLRPCSLGPLSAIPWGSCSLGGLAWGPAMERRAASVFKVLRAVGVLGTGFLNLLPTLV